MIKVTSLLSAIFVFAISVAAQGNNSNADTKAASAVPTASSSPKPQASPELAANDQPKMSPSPAPASNASSNADPVPAPATTKNAAPGAKGAVVLPPEKASPVTIPRFDKAPVIDGKLDDAVWQNAVVLKDFYQIDPGDNVAPSKPTEVLLGYDAKTLFIAFKAFDEPDKIRATVAKRDCIFQDD
jgi:hypothetical protein